MFCYGRMKGQKRENLLKRGVGGTYNRSRQNKQTNKKSSERRKKNNIWTSLCCVVVAKPASNYMYVCMYVCVESIGLYVYKMMNLR
jgi:hypothetical protein